VSQPDAEKSDEQWFEIPGRGRRARVRLPTEDELKECPALTLVIVKQIEPGMRERYLMSWPKWIAEYAMHYGEEAVHWIKGRPYLVGPWSVLPNGKVLAWEIPKHTPANELQYVAGSPRTVTNEELYDRLEAVPVEKRNDVLNLVIRYAEGDPRNLNSIPQASREKFLAELQVVVK
jgi:hypothetical protein